MSKTRNYKCKTRNYKSKTRNYKSKTRNYKSKTRKQGNPKKIFKFSRESKYYKKGGGDELAKRIIITCTCNPGTPHDCRCSPPDSSKPLHTAYMPTSKIGQKIALRTTPPPGSPNKTPPPGSPNKTPPPGSQFKRRT